MAIASAAEGLRHLSTDFVSAVEVCSLSTHQERLSVASQPCLRRSKLLCGTLIAVLGRTPSSSWLEGNQLMTQQLRNPRVDLEFQTELDPGPNPCLLGLVSLMSSSGFWALIILASRHRHALAR